MSTNDVMGHFGFPGNTDDQGAFSCIIHERLLCLFIVCETEGVICRLQVAGCRSRVAGCRSQVAGCRLQVAGQNLDKELDVLNGLQIFPSS